MKTSSILCIALLLGSVGAWAQGPGGTRPLFDFRKKKVDEETKAKAIDAAKTAVKQVPDEVKDKAKEMLISPEAAEMRQKALQAAQAVMQSKSTDAAATTTPEPAAATPGTTLVDTPPPPPVGPQPKPLEPLNLDETPKATKGQILITAQKSAFFDANLGYGIYTGDVRARHPQMYIECEELELFMAKQEGGVLNASKSKNTAPPSKDSDILAPAKKEENAPPPIDKADARGPMVTIEKIAEDGELQIGHCKHLVYDGKTGITTLYDWPQVQAGNQLHKATEAGCVMIIDKGGKLTTTGGNETIILQGEDATPKSRGGMVPQQQ
ncbi:hypothetical protein [Prosthecobacter sp.]|uniref:hypothetical protein n=1 Tax=Prosthecobacter sp. TaxID=1965333 RepID=UPI001D828A0E|nr:hypothetical protein [Prosthecobacter sp.]MCB1277855.1 hypothetical protein [Prosthecobacter sp.]